MFPCALSALDRLGCRWPCCSQVLTVKQLLLLLLPGLLGYKSINTWLVVTVFFSLPLLLLWASQMCYTWKNPWAAGRRCALDAHSAICRCISAAFESPSLPYMPCKNGFHADVYILPLCWLGFWEQQIWSNSAAGADNANPQKISEVNCLHRVTGITRQGSFPINQESELCALNSTLTWAADIIDHCYFPGYSSPCSLPSTSVSCYWFSGMCCLSDLLLPHTQCINTQHQCPAGCTTQVNCS